MQTMVFYGDDITKTISVDQPYIIVRQYEGSCTKMEKEFYTIIGGGKKYFFSKLYEIGKAQPDNLVDPFYTVLAGCYKDIFYILKFDFNRDEYRLIYKKFLRDIPNYVEINYFLTRGARGT